MRSLHQLICLAFGIVCFFVACQSTEIPNAPGEPFAQNRLWITNNSDPKPGTAVNGGANIQFNFEIAFTVVDTIDVENRTNNLIVVDFIGLDNSNQVIRLGGFPDNFFILKVRSGILRNSLIVSVPLDLIAVGLEVHLAQVNTDRTIILVSDFRSWPVNE